MKYNMTVSELIALLNKVEDKNTIVNFHPTSGCAYQTGVVEIRTSEYTKTTTITTK